MAPSGSTEEKPTVFKIGILEVQGAFLEHKNALVKAKSHLKYPVELLFVEVRHPKHVTADLDGLIIPGGESTTISLFLKRNKMEEPLRDWIHCNNHVTWGTCAGMILLSKVTENQKLGGQSTLGVVDTDVSRNFFGRQINSFEAEIALKHSDIIELSGKKSFHGVFIRAPAVLETLSSEVNVLATVHLPDKEKEVVVAVKQGNILSTAFHPELTDDISWHLYFLKMIEERKDK